VLFAFDLLELGSRDLRSAPLEERKRELAKLLRKAGQALHFNEHIDEPGDVVFATPASSASTALSRSRTRFCSFSRAPAFEKLVLFGMIAIGRSQENLQKSLKNKSF
jgi:hypothetical protein